MIPIHRQVDPLVLDNAPQEFPISTSGSPRPGTASVPPQGNTQLVGATRIYRHDRETGDRQEHDLGDGYIPGEFICVPDGAGKAVGWLMGFALNVAEATTVILDARRIAVGRAGRPSNP